MEAVASGITVAAVGFHAGKAVLELKQLYSSFKNVSDDLAEIVGDCVRIDGLLASLRQRQADSASDLPDCSAWIDCNQHCEKAGKVLEETARTLIDRVKNGKVKGSLSYLSKKEMIDKQRRTLEGAKIDLLIADQIFCRQESLAVQRRLLDRSGRLDAALSSAQLTFAAAMADTRTPLQISQVRSVHPDPQLQVPKLQIRRRPKQTEQGRRFLLWCQWWGKTLEMTFKSSPNDLGLQLRLHNTVSTNALVFRYAHNGDVTGLQRLFHSDLRLASVHDRDDVLGETPLHVAIQHRQVEAARFLLQQGADIDAVSLSMRNSKEGATCFRIFWRSLVRLNLLQKETTEEMVNLLTIEYQPEDLLLNRVEEYLDEGVQYLEAPEVFAYFTQQIYTPYKQLDIGFRLNLALKLDDDNPQSFWTVLGQPSIDEPCRAHLLQKGPESLMVFVSVKIVEHRRYGESAEYLVEWRKLLQEAVGLVAQTTSFGASPWEAYWSRNPWHLEVIPPMEVPSYWLHELEVAGQDLSRYGELEYAAFRQGVSTLEATFVEYDPEDYRKICYEIKVLDFSYGPRIEDWYFLVLWSPACIPGDDDENLDSPKASMPGSWVEELDD